MQTTCASTEVRANMAAALLFIYLQFDVSGGAFCSRLTSSSPLQSRTSADIKAIWGAWRGQTSPGEGKAEDWEEIEEEEEEEEDGRHCLYKALLSSWYQSGALPTWNIVGMQCVCTAWKWALWKWLLMDSADCVFFNYLLINKLWRTWTRWVQSAIVWLQERWPCCTNVCTWPRVCVCLIRQRGEGIRDQAPGRWKQSVLVSCPPVLLRRHTYTRSHCKNKGNTTLNVCLFHCTGAKIIDRNTLNNW